MAGKRPTVADIRAYPAAAHQVPVPAEEFAAFKAGLPVK